MYKSNTNELEYIIYTQMEFTAEDVIEEAEENVALEEVPSRDGLMTDEQLLEILEELQTNITVFGCGG